MCFKYHVIYSCGEALSRHGPAPTTAVESPNKGATGQVPELRLTLTIIFSNLSQFYRRPALNLYYLREYKIFSHLDRRIFTLNKGYIYLSTMTTVWHPLLWRFVKIECSCLIPHGCRLSNRPSCHKDVKYSEHCNGLIYAKAVFTYVKKSIIRKIKD